MKFSCPIKCISLDIDGCFTETSGTTHENLTFHRNFQSVFMAIKFTTVVEAHTQNNKLH